MQNEPVNPSKPPPQVGRRAVTPFGSGGDARVPEQPATVAVAPSPADRNAPAEDDEGADE